MRPKLAATNLLVQDILDQPPAEYVVLVEGMLGTKGAFTVTHRKDKDGAVQFYHHERLILEIPYDVRWAMVAMGRVLTPTTEEWVRKDAADTKAIKALGKELRPSETDEPPPPDLEPVSVVILGEDGQPAEGGTYGVLRTHI